MTRPDIPPPAFPGMRIGLMGGSFNPAHEGHRHIAVAALQRLGLHQVWWIVTPGNPLKSRAGLASFGDRMAQARKIAAHPRIIVTGFEAGLPTPYSADTICFLRRRFPRTHFAWIGGGDILTQFHRWKHWRKICAMLPIAIFDRPDCRFAALAAPAAVHFGAARISPAKTSLLAAAAPPAWGYFTLPTMDISSTAIRQGAAEQPNPARFS
jgi:nicotinate-nucleotide adenylyltransferase